MDDPIFAGLGWDTMTCKNLVSNDDTLKQAVCECFEQESLDPLRIYEDIPTAAHSPKGE